MIFTFQRITLISNQKESFITSINKLFLYQTKEFEPLFCVSLNVSITSVCLFFIREKVLYE